MSKKIGLKFVIAGIFILFSASNLLSQHFKVSGVPEWVQQVEIPENSKVSKYDLVSGYYLALFDNQINLEKSAYFYREVINVVSYGGITDASQLAVNYDTVYQHLTVHHLYIWRNGKKIDRTKDLNFKILNKENNLPIGIYTGNITAYDILNDIRKDDLIDFAYTITGDNPIFNNEKYQFIAITSLNPIDLYHLRVLYKNENDYIYRFVTDDSAELITDTITGNYKTLNISLKDVEAFKPENNMVTWMLNFKYFNLSSMHSWKDVNKWAEDVFALNKEPDLSSVFEEIFTGNESIDDKINKIINFVKDDIRYMGIESGIGSIKPFNPKQVVKQRFGDCKDKSLLMVSLLKQIGVEEAYPVLANSVVGKSLDELLPGPGTFNHTIVMFKHDGKEYWIDPSISQQGGYYKNIFTPNYGKVLIIGKPSDTLFEMPYSDVKSVTDITEEFTVESFDKPTKLKITSCRYGFDADQRRVIMEYLTTENISDGVMKSLQLIFPEVSKTGDVEINDDIENNVFKTVYNYEVDGYWENKTIGDGMYAKEFRLFKFEPVTLYDYMNLGLCKERKYAYSLVYPLNIKYHAIFHFPQEMFIDDENKVLLDNDFFYLKEELQQLSTNSLRIDYTYKVKKKFIGVEEFKNVCNEVNKVINKFPHVIYFEK